MEQNHLLENGEVVLEKIRKHWIVYFEDFFLHLFGCLVCIVPAYYLASHGNIFLLSDNDRADSAMVLITFVLIFWISFFYFWTKSYFDVWYITDRHIISVNQKHMLEREETYMELARIQDVFFEKNGFIQTFLGCGTLKVQSAGTNQEFVIEYIKNVEESAHRIMELRDATQNTAHL